MYLVYITFRIKPQGEYISRLLLSFPILENMVIRNALYFGSAITKEPFNSFDHPTGTFVGTPFPSQWNKVCGACRRGDA